MGWKNVAKLASGWAEAKKDELLTTDKDKRLVARRRAEELQELAKEEVGTSVFEKVLPADLAKKVTEQRPENVEARRVQTAEREESQRQARLSDLAGSGATADLTLTVSGGEQGSLAVTLPCERHEEHPAPEDLEYGGLRPLAWLRVVLEAPHPVPLGSTSLAALSLAVPDFRGPGRYDLADLHRRGESGEIEPWEAFEIFASPVTEVDDRTWYVDVHAEGDVVIDVSTEGLSFDLPLASAVSSMRATGSVRW